VEGGTPETRLGSSPSGPISLSGLTPGTILGDRYRGGMLCSERRFADLFRSPARVLRERPVAFGCAGLGCGGRRRVAPGDASKDKGEIPLLFGWAEGLKPLER